MFNRLFWIPTGTLFAAGLLVSSAGATAVNSVTFADGEPLNVKQVVGTGANSAYLAIDFDSGATEAFEYKFDGTTNGYALLTAIAGTVNGTSSGPTSLTETDKYYGAPYDEHLIYTLADGTDSVEYPGLFFSPPVAADSSSGATYGTSSQGISYEDAPYGVDQVAVGNGTIVAFDVYGSGLPVLPEVPEPVSASTLGVIGLIGLFKRRR